MAKSKYDPEKRRGRYLQNQERDKKAALEYYYQHIDDIKKKKEKYYQENKIRIRQKVRIAMRELRAKRKLQQTS